MYKYRIVAVDASGKVLAVVPTNSLDPIAATTQAHKAVCARGGAAIFRVGIYLK